MAPDRIRHTQELSIKQWKSRTSLVLACKPRVVLCDFYDTVVHRSVAPEHVKEIACARLASSVFPSIGAASLYKTRARLEIAACEANQELGFDMEFKLADLALALHHELALSPGYSAAQWVQELLDIELEVEKRVQQVASGFLAFAEAVRDGGIPLVLVSDNYLSRVALLRLLQHHGLAALFADVIVSSDYLLTKRSGRLYDVVLDRYQFPPEQMIMLGDNEHSDVACAKAHGLKTMWIDSSDVHERYRTFAKFACAARPSLQTQSAAQVDADLRFARIGETLALFSERLYAALRSRGATTVLFMSREGQLLKKIFDDFQQTCVLSPAARVKSKYFYVSRRATLLASCQPLEAETFETLFRQYQRISVADFLSSLGFPAASRDMLRSEIGAAFDQTQDWFSTSEVFQQLISLVSFREIYEQERVAQRDLLNQYIEGLCESDKTLYIVDVGWKGTIQDNLFRFLLQARNVDGFYLGLIANSLPSGANEKTGLVFDFRLSGTHAWRVYNENRAMFEVFLAADHGSVRRYYSGEDGSVQPLLDDVHAVEVAAFDAIAPTMQNIRQRAIELFESAAGSALTVEDFAISIVDRHADLVLNPTNSELSTFEGLAHYENFGRFGVSAFSQSGNSRFVEKLATIARVVIHPSRPVAEDSTWWPPLRLKQLGLNWAIARYAAAKRSQLDREISTP